MAHNLLTCPAVTVVRYEDALAHPEQTCERLATTLSLVVIFLPVSFMSSISGRFLYQFGITAAVAVSALFDRVDSPVQVLTRSGITLVVSFERDKGPAGESLRELRLTGDARVVYRADLGNETTRGFDPDWVRNPTEQAPQP